MAPARHEIEATITEFLDRVMKPATLTPELALFADGIDLDSLETAELSALLEDTFGSDPFMSEEMPQTIGEIFDFYDRSLVSDA